MRVGTVWFPVDTPTELSHGVEPSALHMQTRDVLKQLQEDMRLELDGELFFFPEWDGVKGFNGDGKVWFIAPKPSLQSEFPTRHDELLYGTLKEYGLANAHITDISKIQGKADNGIPEEELERNRPFLEREIEILQPELLVTVGNGAICQSRTPVTQVLWGFLRPTFACSIVSL